MPIVVGTELRIPTQDEFATIAYDVMHHLFAIHNEYGRFFREEIYKQEFMLRMEDVQLEVPIDVSFDRFSKRYRIDVLVDRGAVFELKTVEALGPKHRAQLLHYLLLAELPHGKLVNMRPEVIEQEFVNTTLRLADRRQFAIIDDASERDPPHVRQLNDLFVAIVRDWGTGLDLELYTEAVTELLGGPSQVIADIDILSGVRPIGSQKVHLAGPETAFKITSIDERGRDRFADHSRRFVQHTRLAALLWINVTLHEVAFRTIWGQNNRGQKD